MVSTLDERPGADFVVVGEAVNRAARLQAAAPPGGVLISADTCRHVLGRFALERRAGLHLKGIDAPVDAFLVLAEGSRSFWPEGHGVEGVATRTVGRAVELRRLQDWFAEVVEEQVWRTVTVVGDAGVGKSRLLFELDHWLAGLTDGVWVLRARASAANAIVPYHLLRELFANRFEISDSDPPALVADKWLAGMRTGNHEVTDHSLIAAAWLGFEIGDDHAAVAGMRHDPRGLSEIGATALEAFLATLTDQAPLVLELEDLHWADEASLDWLERAARRLGEAPVIVVATARPALLQARPHWGEGLAHHARLALEPLSRRRSLLLLQEILQRADDVPPAVADFVVTTAEGNPFYTEELVKWLVEQGLIRTGDRWHVDEAALAGLRVPPTLKGVLQARLDALSPVERNAVQRASVVGRVFWDGAVSAAAGLSPETTQVALDGLRAREVVYRREQSSFVGACECVFKHALVRDVAYESVLRTRRQSDHARIARWLADATQRSGRADEYAGLIAGHHEQAGEDAAAAAWYLRAGRHAAKVFANTDALALLGKALATAAGDHALRFDVLAERESVLDRLGDRPAQEADLDAMAVELTEVDDPRRKAQLLVARARWSFLHSDYAAQSVFASEGAALARAAGLLDMEANAVLWWGKGLTWAYEHDEARSTLEQALALARRAGLRSDEAETLRYLAIVASNQSRLAEAEQLLHETLELRRLDHDVEGEGSTLGQLGTVLYNQGRFDESADALTRAREIFVRSGHKYKESITVGNLGAIATEQGRLGLARRLGQDGLRLSTELEDREGIGTAHSALGELARFSGELEEVRAQMAQALAIADEIGYDYLAANSLYALALIEASEGHHAEAERQVTEGIGLAQRAGVPIVVARGRLVHGLTLLAAGQPARAVDELRHARAEEAISELHTMQRECIAGLAAAALAQGHLDEAVTLVEELLPWLDVRGVEGGVDPAQVFVTCVRVLDAADDPRADDARRASHAYLAEMVARIDEDALAEGFLGPRAPAAALVALTGFTPPAGS